MTYDRLKLEFLEAEAESLGFFLCGVTPINPPEHFLDYQDWISKGLHGGMGYLARPDDIAKRGNPALLLPGARSLISLGIPYFPAHQAPSSPNARTTGRVAAYAWGVDYHDILPPLLLQLVERFSQNLDYEFSFKVYTDSSPILERGYACRAGLGWIGKNSCLIHPERGSYFLLAEILTDMELPPSDHQMEDHCGTCQRCIQACPTGCILPDRTLDARRCISYLTIENKGEIPLDLQPSVGNWVFGCDICQMVCPWNQRFARPPTHSTLQQVSTLAWVDLVKELSLSRQDFDTTYKNSPISRTRFVGWLRNCIVAAGNLKSEELYAPLSSLLHNNPEPLLRKYAAFAVWRFETPKTQSDLQNALEFETDPQVQLTIQSLLGSKSR